MPNTSPSPVIRTYSRREAAPILEVSNPTVGNLINAAETKHPGFISGTMIDDRLTEETIERLRLWKNDRDAFRARVAEVEAEVSQPQAVRPEVLPPEGHTAIGSEQRSVGQIEIFDATTYNNQASAAMQQWQDMQTQLASRTNDMADSNAALDRATKAAGQALAANVLMNVASEAAQGIAAGMPQLQEAIAQMVAMKSQLQPGKPASDSNS